jgi:hypothetical protein
VFRLPTDLAYTLHNFPFFVHRIILKFQAPHNIGYLDLPFMMFL